jgi:hypothetical protein
MKHLETERSAPISSKSRRRYMTTTIKTFAAVALAAAALSAIDATGNAFAGQLAGVVRAPNLTKNSGLTGLIPVPKVLPNPLPLPPVPIGKPHPIGYGEGHHHFGHGRYDYGGFSDYGSCYFIKRYWTILKVCPDYD